MDAEQRLPNVVRILEDAIAWDNHACMPLRPGDDTFMPQLERHRVAGFTVVMLNVGFGGQSPLEHLRMLAHFRRWIAKYPDKYLLLKSIADIEEAKSSNRLCIGFNIEGADAIAEDLNLISLYYSLGVRWMLLCYNKNNRTGGGLYDDDHGLTAFGRSVLDEMQLAGMVPCCTHTGYRTAAQIIDHVDGPVIFSHSNPRAVYDHPRNIPDDLIHACADKGGVIGINGFGTFLGPNDASTETLLRHIDHVVNLVGPQHVALGLDYVFDYSELEEYHAKMKSAFPPEMGCANARVSMIEPERLPEIVHGLVARGYSSEHIKQLLGANLLRIAYLCWT